MEKVGSVVTPAESGEVVDDTTIKTTGDTQPKEPVHTHTEGATPKEGKTYDRDALNKIIASEVKKAEESIRREYEEKEKVAKMNDDEKLRYELEEQKKEVQKYKDMYTSANLKSYGNEYASQKGLPLGYLDDIDYTRETEETIRKKVDNFVKLRSQDRDNTLKNELKQDKPKEVGTITPKEENKYLEGFNGYFDKYKK